MATFDKSLTTAELFGPKDSPWGFGPYLWPVRQLTILRAVIPVRGQQGLWDLPEFVLEQVKELQQDAMSWERI